jgi:hypothetical protein
MWIPVSVLIPVFYGNQSINGVLCPDAGIARTQMKPRKRQHKSPAFSLPESTTSPYSVRPLRQVQWGNCSGQDAVAPRTNQEQQQCATNREVTLQRHCAKTHTGRAVKWTSKVRQGPPLAHAVTPLAPARQRELDSLSV